MNEPIYGQIPPDDMGMNPPPMTPDMQGAMRVPQGAQMPQNPQSDMAIAQAREMLGLDKLEADMASAKAEATYKDNLAEALSKYPELTKSVIETELEKLSQTDPDLANQFRASKAGMDMFVKGLRDDVKPDKKPDDITDDSATTAQNGEGDPTLDRIKKGQANDVELGKYILSMSKKR